MAEETTKTWREKLRLPTYTARPKPPPDPPGVTVAEWQVRAAKFASLVAMCVLVYFLWLYTTGIAGDRAAALHLTHAGGWTGDLQFWFPYIIGFAGIAFGIPYVAKISIPTFMALDWKTAFWPKLWALGIAMSVSLVIIAGTFTVQGETILERDRDAAVAVEQVEQSAAVLAAQITAAETRLREMRNNPNAYMAQAASVGAAEWERSYVAQARATGDARLPMIERALGAARAADAKQAELDGLRAQQATATGTASVARRVEGASEATSWMGRTLDWVESIRAILLSLVMDVVCLMMPWIARHLELRRNAQLAAADDQPETVTPRALPDLRGEEITVETVARDAAYAAFSDGATAEEAAEAARNAVAPGPQKTARDKDTGEDAIWVGGHWRKKTDRNTPKKDETGVTDHRTGSVAEEMVAGLNDMGESVAEQPSLNYGDGVGHANYGPERKEEQHSAEINGDERVLNASGNDDAQRKQSDTDVGGQQHQDSADDMAQNHIQPSETSLTDDELLALEETDAQATEPEHVALPGNDGVMLVPPAEDEAVYDHPPAPRRELVAAE